MRNKGFYLAEGSGLALQISHRISEDLDFFTNHPFEPSSLLIYPKSEVGRLQQILAEAQTLIADLDGVKCSFFLYDVPLLFDLVSSLDFEVADWRDILAEKFKTVAQRGSKKDSYEIFSVIEIKRIPLDEAVSIFKKRFQSSGLNLYHILQSLSYFEDADQEPDPKMMEGCDFSWEEVKSFFLTYQPEMERFFLK